MNLSIRMADLIDKMIKHYQNDSLEQLRHLFLENCEIDDMMDTLEYDVHQSADSLLIRVMDFVHLFYHNWFHSEPNMNGLPLDDAVVILGNTAAKLRVGDNRLDPRVYTRP